MSLCGRGQAQCWFYSVLLLTCASLLSATATATPTKATPPPSHVAKGDATAGANPVAIVRRTEDNDNYDGDTPTVEPTEAYDARGTMSPPNSVNVTTSAGRDPVTIVYTMDSADAYNKNCVIEVYANDPHTTLFACAPIRVHAW